jgi:predicted  nucleic acid-binding Zn-ribbon protein
LEAEAGQEARACIRLSGGALQAWNSMSRSEKVRLATLFKELILYYAASKRLPIPPLQVVLQATDTVATAYTVCEQEKRKLQERTADLEEEIEELKQRLATGETYKQQVETIARQLEEEKARAQQLERLQAQLRDRIKHMENQLERLATTLCPHEDKLKQMLAGDSRAVVEIEALCWRRRAQT